MNDLAKSIKEIGVLQPLLVREISKGRYELIALPLRIEGADASPVRAILKSVPG